MKSRSRHVLGGRYGETGSVLIYALVLFGLCTVMLSASISAESSAQTLNIKTGHRRKALDLARGVVDEMHLAFVHNGFSLSGLNGIFREDSQGEWEAKASISKERDLVLIEGEATVRQVTENVSLWLEPEFEDEGFFPNAVLTAGESIAIGTLGSGVQVVGDIRSGSGKVDMSDPAHESKWQHNGTMSLINKNAVREPGEVGNMADAFKEKTPDTTTWTPISPLGGNLMVQTENCRIGGLSNSGGLNLSVGKNLALHVGENGDLGLSGGPSITLEDSARVYIDGSFLMTGASSMVLKRGARFYVGGSLKVSGSLNLTLEEGAVLYINGHVDAWTAAVTLNGVKGVLVCDGINTFNGAVNQGSVNQGPGKQDDVFTIISLDDVSLYKQFGDGSVDLICMGTVKNLQIHGNPRHLRVYGEKATVTFHNTGSLALNPARFVAYDDLDLSFKGGKVLLQAGADGVSELMGSDAARYRVVKWQES